jgi:hypothetical protein
MDEEGIPGLGTYSVPGWGGDMPPTRESAAPTSSPSQVPATSGAPRQERLQPHAQAALAAPNKCLALSNKSCGRAETTKGRPTECPYVEYSENRGPN